MIEFTYTFSLLLQIVLFFYCAFILIQFLVIGITLYSWNILAPRFKYFVVSSVSFIAFGFWICLYFLITQNTFDQCSFARKVAYASFYIGFCIYDFYQIQKIMAITLSHYKVGYVLYSLLVIRAGAYMYNVFTVSATVSIQNIELATGPCTSTFSSIGIYQEHFFSIMFEVALGIVFGASFIKQYKQTKSGVGISQFIQKLIDFELVCFGVFFITEIIFIITYSFMDLSYLSLLQTFYLNVPVVLLFVGVLIFRMKNRYVNTIPEKTKANSSTSYFARLISSDSTV